MSGAITFEWDNPNQLLTQVQAMLEARAGAIRRVPDAAVRRGTFALLAMIKNSENTPKKTGTLVRSITATVEKIGTDLIEGRVGTWLKYARYLEEGTGIYGPKQQPIEILPKSKRALFWGAYDDKGKRIVAKRVLVKGIKPRQYFAKAIAEFLPKYVQIIEEELKKAA